MHAADPAIARSGVPLRSQGGARMLTTTRARLTALVATGAMSLGAAGAAEARTQQEGLGDVNANVLAEQLRQGGAECDADAESIATNGPGHGGSTRQSGLVNVNAEDI